MQIIGFKFIINKYIYIYIHTHTHTYILTPWSKVLLEKPDNWFQGHYIYIYIVPFILTLALDGEEWLASRSDRFIPGERASGAY